jgi:pyridoxal biosynthesis lyase PdxS
MDVVNAEQARIAEEAGACAVMALERVPADIRKDGVCQPLDATIWIYTKHGFAVRHQTVD